MASQTPWGWIAGGVGAVGLLWLSARSRSAKAPSSPRNAASSLASPIALPTATPPVAYYSYVVKSTGVDLGPNARVSSMTPPLPGAQGSFLSINNSTGGLFHQEWELAYAREHYGKIPQKVQAFWEAQSKLFSDRRLSMAQQHTDFRPDPDKYSKSANLVFRPEHSVGYTLPLQVPISQTYGKLTDKWFEYRPWGWYLTDEFGRPYEGWGAGGGFDFLQVVSTVSNAVLPWIPGYGTAANVAIQTTIALAQGKSMKDVALAAARAALPGGAAFAFDLGVGIVIEGKSPKDAVVQAAVTELDKKYPGARAAYEQGQALAKNVQQQPTGTQGLVFGGVF